MQTIHRPPVIEAQPFKTGIPGIVEYWSQGCYREYGWAWWVSIVTAWSRMKHSLTALR